MLVKIKETGEVVDVSEETTLVGYYRYHYFYTPEGLCFHDDEVVIINNKKMEDLRNIYTDFFLAKKLAKRGGCDSALNLPPFTQKWYNRNGVVVATPTEMPFTKYSVIRSWLEDVGVLFATQRITGTDNFLSCIYIRIYDGKKYMPGKEPYRRYGKIYFFKDFETAEATTLERAVMAVPVLK